MGQLVKTKVTDFCALPTAQVIVTTDVGKVQSPSPAERPMQFRGLSGDGIGNKVIDFMARVPQATLSRNLVVVVAEDNAAPAFHVAMPQPLKQERVGFTTTGGSTVYHDVCFRGHERGLWSGLWRECFFGAFVAAIVGDADGRIFDLEYRIIASSDGSSEVASQFSEKSDSSSVAFEQRLLHEPDNDGGVVVLVFRLNSKVLEVLLVGLTDDRHLHEHLCHLLHVLLSPPCLARSYAALSTVLAGLFRRRHYQVARI